MALRAVLFDLDGTLVDSAPAIAAALSAVRRARDAGPIPPHMVRPWISLGAPELVRRGLGIVSRSPEDDLTEFRRVLAVTPTRVDSLYPGVRQMLTGLRAASLDLAIVTNKPESLARRLLQALDLEEPFGAIVGGDSVATCKPDPGSSLAALAALGHDPKDAVFVGDSLVDAQTAAALGLPFHLYEGGYGTDGCAQVRTASRFSSHLVLLETFARSKMAVNAEPAA